MNRSLHFQTLLESCRRFILRQGTLTTNPGISSLTCDSRTVVPGALFVGLRGAKVNGAEHLHQAQQNGAVAAILEGEPIDSPSNFPYAVVSDGRRCYANLANAFYDYPSRTLKLVGVTGTNGKTSVAWILAEALALLSHGRSVGYVGTLGLRSFSSGEGNTDLETVFKKEVTNTSPDPEELHAYLSTLVADNGVAAAIEASSWGLVQHRLTGVEWNAAVFTNLTRDHLDVHQTMEEYGNAKASLFLEQLTTSPKTNRFAVLNADDEFARMLAQKVKALGVAALLYSTQRSDGVDACVLHSDLKSDGTDLEFKLGGTSLKIQSRLVGNYNVSNLLGCALVLHGLEYRADEISAALSRVSPVPGRLQLVAASDVRVFVDYAHTPDALIAAQRSLRDLTTGRLITVFGCGGDRDRGKRPLMGEAVASASDLAVVTSDNPRSEKPEDIISGIIPGLSGKHAQRGFFHEVIADRRQAIEAAISLAKPGDVVLVAGKGHEPYQEIQGVKHPFSDVDVSREILSEKGLL